MKLNFVGLSSSTHLPRFSVKRDSSLPNSLVETIHFDYSFSQMETRLLAPSLPFWNVWKPRNKIRDPGGISVPISSLLLQIRRMTCITGFYTLLIGILRQIRIGDSVCLPRLLISNRPLRVTVSLRAQYLKMTLLRLLFICRWLKTNLVFYGIIFQSKEDFAT